MRHTEFWRGDLRKENKRRWDDNIKTDVPEEAEWRAWIVSG